MKIKKNIQNRFSTSLSALFIIITFIAALILTGCEGGTARTSTGGKAGAGLTLEAETITPLIYDSDYLDMEILLKNEGSYSIPQGKAALKLGGYDPSLFSFDNNGIKRLGRIEGITSQSTGFSDYESFGRSRLKDGFLGESLPEISPTFIITACYPYQTESSAEVCINPDIYSKNPKVGECKAGSAKAYNTNAPISVSSIQERFLSYDSGSGILKVKFDVTISNIGKGKVWSSSDEHYMYECGKYHSNVKEIQNKIKIISAKLSGNTLDCTSDTGDNSFKLIGNSATISCIGEIRANQAFTTQMFIVFEYGYSNYISKKVTIKSSKYSN
jgi:hypothetical protein